MANLISCFIHSCPCDACDIEGVKSKPKLQGNPSQTHYKIKSSVFACLCSCPCLGILQSMWGLGKQSLTITKTLAARANPSSMLKVPFPQLRVRCSARSSRSLQLNISYSPVVPCPSQVPNQLGLDLVLSPKNLRPCSTQPGRGRPGDRSEQKRRIGVLRRCVGC